MRCIEEVVVLVVHSDLWHLLGKTPNGIGQCQFSFPSFSIFQLSWLQAMFFLLQIKLANDFLNGFVYHRSFSSVDGQPSSPYYGLN